MNVGGNWSDLSIADIIHIFQMKSTAENKKY